MIEAGTGPLALCLHGFPDSAHTWRHLLPELAEAGFHAVAPFMRGYAPSAIPADRCYRLGALIAAAFEYIEAFYNRQRRHSTLGMLSPATYEQLHLSPLDG